MTIKKATEILERQKAKLDEFDNKNQNWVFQTVSYIKDFFGENFTEFSFISQFTFSIASTSWDSKEDIKRWLAEKPNEACMFFGQPH